jgi:hypothetical protein
MRASVKPTLRDLQYGQDKIVLFNIVTDVGADRNVTGAFVVSTPRTPRRSARSTSEEFSQLGDDDIIVLTDLSA